MSAISGLRQSVASGKVFARYQLDTSNSDPLIESLNYASTQGAIRSVTQLKEIGAAVLDELRKNFPSRNDSTMQIIKSARGYRAIRPKSMHLASGWRVTYYDAGFGAASSSLLGFYISHRKANVDRIRTILASLESGSRAYTIRPVHKKALRFAFPYRRPIMEVLASQAEIPAREGFGYLAKTEDFADKLLASRGSYMEDLLVRLIEDGERFRERELTANSIDREVPDELEEAAGSVTSSLSSPLKRLRKVKRRLSSRKFGPTYR